MKRYLLSLVTILLVGSAHADNDMNRAVFEAPHESLAQAAVLLSAPILNINVAVGGDESDIKVAADNKCDLAGSQSVSYGTEVTPMPVITYEMTDNAVVITATGVGKVKMYVDGEVVENPCAIERGEEDRIVVVIATAQGEGMLISDFAFMEIIIPALEQTAAPVIITEDNGEAVVVTATGNGHICIYWDDQLMAEGEGTATWTIPYGEDPEGEEYGISATAQEEGKLVSDYARATVFVPGKPVVPQTTEAPVITYVVNDENVVITATGEGEVKMYVDGVEVENPCVVERGEKDKIVVVTAIAQGEGMLISDVAYMEITIPAMEGGNPVNPHMTGYWLVYCGQNGERHYNPLKNWGTSYYESSIGVSFSECEGGFGNWVFFYFLLDGVSYGPSKAMEWPEYDDECVNPMFENMNSWVVPWSLGGHQIGIEFNDNDGCNMGIRPLYVGGGDVTDMPEINWHYVETGVEVTAVGKGIITLYVDYELVKGGSGKASWTIPYGDVEKEYEASAFACEWYKYPSWWPAWEILRVPGKNNEPQDLSGEIVIGDPDEDGHVSIEYIGDEDVTMVVTVNGEVVDVVDGMITVGYGESVIVVTVSAEGYYKDLVATKVVTYEPGVEPSVTPMPVITYEVTDNAVVITATGEGEVIMYVDGKLVENPCEVERGEEDRIVVVTATAQGEGMLISDLACMEITIPAIADPHMTGYWVVLYDKEGNEVWLELTSALPYDPYQFVTIVALRYSIYGGRPVEPGVWEDADNPMVPFYIMIDGVRYSCAVDNTEPVYGDASKNPLYVNEENYWIVRAGYYYVIGVIINPVNGDKYLQAARRYIGIDEVNADKAVAGVRYFNMAGQEMLEADGMTIVVTTYTDGSTSAVKVIK